MKVLKLTIAFLLAAIFLNGCVQSPHADQTLSEIRPEGARLSNTEAIQIAIQTAEREGVDLKSYKVREAYSKFYREDRRWHIGINGRVPMPGNHFSVSVDDRTGGAKFHPGF